MKQRVGIAFLGLSILYAVYAAGALVAFEPDTSFAYRLVMVVGMAVFPLPVLLAPAVFIAALDGFELSETHGVRVRVGPLWFLGMVALGAGLTAAVGPFAFDRALEAVGAAAPAAIPQEGMVADARARTMMPIAVALFVVVSAVAGAVIGRMTAGLSDDRRIVTRWVAGVSMVALFFFTTFAVSELIVMQGALSPIWLAIAPPLVPFLLTCVVARRDCARIAQSLLARVRERRPQMDPSGLDGLITTIRNADDPDAAIASAIAKGDVDRDMAALVAGLSHVAAPTSGTDESCVQEIVDVLSAPPGPDAQVAPQPIDTLPGPGRIQIAAAVVVVWISLTSGLLLLGGAVLAPPTVASASAAGVLGAWATVEIACRDKARAMSSVPI